MHLLSAGTVPTLRPMTPYVALGHNRRPFHSRGKPSKQFAPGMKWSPFRRRIFGKVCQKAASQNEPLPASIH
jgi:hypothetical protein